MTYLGSWEIDDDLVFAVATHTAATGAVTDADAVPAYRVYEMETGTAILTGNMAKLDDSNTTGFYSEQIALSAANGFEVGKSYSIYISAAVATVTGVTVYNFQVEAAKATAAAVAALNDVSTAQVQTAAAAALTAYDPPTSAELVSEINSVQADIAALGSTAAITVVAAVVGSTITLYRGTTWVFTLTGLPTLTAYDTVFLTVKSEESQPDTEALLKVYNHLMTGLIRFNGAAPVSAANGKMTVDSATAITVTAQEAETVSAPLGEYKYDVKGIDDNGNVVMLLAGGSFNVEADYTRAIVSPP